MFQPALEEMQRSGRAYTLPQPFQEYCQRTGRAVGETARFISVDSLARLDQQLERQGCMVFRLGSPQGETNTHFALARCFGGWDDYFLFDEKLFGKAAPKEFEPTAPERHLLPFRVLPSFTETSLVNLALASGLMAEALGIEREDVGLVPATGQSRFSFEFRVHERVEEPWRHSRGQVEIDSLFTARRQGKQTIFVIESKAGRKFDSLAKHKLVYPVLAVREKLEGDAAEMAVVPVYLRVVHETDGYHFYFAECKLELKDNECAVLSNLEAVSQQHFVVRGF